MEVEATEFAKSGDISDEASFLNGNLGTENMLNHLAFSEGAFFKSQQIDDPELTVTQKREIAKELLSRNPEQFLARFGKHLELRHLDYFACSKYDTYEIRFHLNQLRRSLCREKNQVDVRNRRYQALKKLLDEGTYFSETEMMKRNPLLYEQLIGQFLTRKEKRERDKSDDNTKTFLTVLLEQLDREEIERLKQQQKDDEEGAVEEFDTSEEEEEEEEEYEEESVMNGGNNKEETSSQSEQEEAKNDSDGESDSSKKKLPSKERQLLREEFVTQMYQSFLDGKDKDFDYSSQVDANPEYECLAVRTQDEEERYFDAESPEIISDEEQEPQIQNEEEDEEDELDLFMKNLKPEPTPSDLADDMQNL